MEKRNTAEIKLQSDAYTNIYNSRPELRGRIFAVNNNSENAIKGAMNKAMGVYSGVSDMIFICDNGKVIFIEWKTPEGKQSNSQNEWQKITEKLGHTYIIVRSEKEFLEVIEKYK